jgi:hypothetical protein
LLPRFAQPASGFFFFFFFFLARFVCVALAVLKLTL